MVERVAEDVESALMGIAEVVGWDLRHAAGKLVVAGEEQDEPRLLNIVRASLLALTEIRAQHVDVVVFNAVVELSRRRAEL
jgi:hypothetical protein